MKALTLTQPWASLVAIGAKRIETRSWRGHHYGYVAIHAAKGFPPEARDLTMTPQYRQALLNGRAFPIGGRPHHLPLGAIVAICELTGYFTSESLSTISAQERHFGDYSPGRWGWRLTLMERLAEPIACRGTLGLWDVPADVVAQIAKWARS